MHTYELKEYIDLIKFTKAFEKGIKYQGLLKDTLLMTGQMTIIIGRICSCSLIYVPNQLLLPSISIAAIKVSYSIREKHNASL